MNLGISVHVRPYLVLTPLAVAACGIGPNLVAATLTAVPMQGGMVMPMIGYHAEEPVGHLHVMLDPAVPELTPLLVSNPADAFAAGDPWYDALDPAGQGLAFSRRYGFVMDAMTDPLPASVKIWLRKLGGPPSLAAYRYANSAPKAFEPIFGTAGSPAAMAWNGMMFHPVFAAPPGTNTYTATFDAYLADAVTGVEIADSSTGPFDLTWTSVPDGRPSLTIATRVEISWPAVTGTWVLEAADSATAANWSVVAGTPTSVGGRLSVLVEPSASTKVYRLRKSS